MVDYFIDLISLQAVLRIWDASLASVGLWKGDENCSLSLKPVTAIHQLGGVNVPTLRFLICKVGAVSTCAVILLWGTHEVADANTTCRAKHRGRREKRRHVLRLDPCLPIMLKGQLKAWWFLHFPYCVVAGEWMILMRTRISQWFSRGPWCLHDAFTLDSKVAAAVPSCDLPTQLHSDISTKKRRLSALLEGKAHPRKDCHGEQVRISTALSADGNTREWAGRKEKWWH